MRTADFDYDLPEELIAQEPSQVRGEDRMLVLDPATSDVTVGMFESLPDYLRPGDAIVLNNTRVIPARMFARKEPTGAEVELFYLNPDSEGRWICLAKGAKRLKEGTVLKLRTADGELSQYDVTVAGKLPDGTCLIDLSGNDPAGLFAACGHLPLPPYIKRPDQPLDSDRYQTIYAQRRGAVAAPTAGLHFTERTFAALEAKGVERIELTLHVGAGTFKPVSEENIEDHPMHAEQFVFPPDAADRLNRVRASGGRILAVGTTSLRTLESCVDDRGVFSPRSGETSIYIYPPYRVKSADMLLTNFHLPKSTLLMLVSAFAGMEPVRKAYEVAVRERMKFFSYGDCMLITGRI